MSVSKISNVTFTCWHGYVSHFPESVKTAYFSYIVNIAFDLLFCLPVTIVNALVIAAVFSSPSLKRKPSIVLLCSLAFTDLGVGLVAQPLHAVSRIAEVIGDLPTYCVTWIISRTLGMWFLNMSLLTMAAISVDRFMAIHLKTRYHHVVTSKRLTAILVVLWFVAAFISSVRLFATHSNFLLVIACCYLLCLGVLLLAYLKSFHSLSAHQINIQNHPENATVNIVSYRYSLNSMLFILGFGLLSYLPFICLCTYVALTGGWNTFGQTAWTIADMLIFFNSAINPFLYYWRITHFRVALRRICLRCKRRLNYNEEESATSPKASQCEAENKQTVKLTKFSKSERECGQYDIDKN